MARAFSRAFRCTLFLLLVLAGVYVWGSHHLYSTQDSRIFHPERDWKAAPDSAGLDYENVRFKTEDGLELSGWFVAASRPQGTVLFCHGNAGNISTRLDALRHFWELGLSVFVFDYRSYGKSDEAALSEEAMYKDGEAAWQYLAERRGLAPAEILVAGHSLGAAVAADIAARHSPKALILESGLSSVTDRAAELYPYFPVRWLLKHPFDTAKKLSAVRCPVLVVHSRADEVAPFRHGQRLFKAAREPKWFAEIDGPHTEGYAESKQKYRRILLEFLKNLSNLSDSGILKDNGTPSR